MRGFVIGLVVIVMLGAIVLSVWQARPAPQRLADPTNTQQVAQGRGIYVQHCASCHGANLEGQPNWKQELPEGGRPAPPHDATGHTWHHADTVLFAIVQQGPAWSTTPGSVYRMPAFRGTLSDSEIWAVLAYIKSTWPADIQAIQEEVNRQSQ